MGSSDHMAPHRTKAETKINSSSPGFWVSLHRYPDQNFVPKILVQSSRLFGIKWENFVGRNIKIGNENSQVESYSCLIITGNYPASFCKNHSGELTAI